jgi:hypothetical protein
MQLCREPDFVSVMFAKVSLIVIVIGVGILLTIATAFVIT